MDIAGNALWSQRGMHVNANEVKTSLMPTIFPDVHLADSRNLFNVSLDGSKWRAIDMRAIDMRAIDMRAIDMGRGFVIGELALEESIQETPGYNSNHPASKRNASRAV